MTITEAGLRVLDGSLHVLQKRFNICPAGALKHYVWILDSLLNSVFKLQVYLSELF